MGQRERIVGRGKGWGWGDNWCHRRVLLGLCFVDNGGVGGDDIVDAVARVARDSGSVSLERTDVQLDRGELAVGALDTMVDTAGARFLAVALDLFSPATKTRGVDFESLEVEPHSVIRRGHITVVVAVVVSGVVSVVVVVSSGWIG